MHEILSTNQVFNDTTILIYAGGGHGKALIDTLHAQGAYRIAGIIDETLPVGLQVSGVPVLGDSEILDELHARGIRLVANGVGGIGDVDSRMQAFERLTSHGFLFPTIIHPSAWVEPTATLDSGVQILPFAYVGSDAHIGFGSVFNVGAVAAHDAQIGKVVNLSPNATLAGNVTVNDYAQIGMCATVNVGLTIGSRARIGNGATIKADVPPGTRVYAGTIWPLPRRPHPYGHIVDDQEPTDCDC